MAARNIIVKTSRRPRKGTVPLSTIRRVVNAVFDAYYAGNSIQPSKTKRRRKAGNTTVKAQ